MIERNAFLSFLFVACLNGGDPTIVGEVFRLYEMVPPVSSEDRLAVAAKQSERLSEILVNMHNEAHVSTIDAVDAVFWELQLSLNLARVKQSLSVASKSVERCCDRLRVIHGSLDRIQESRQFDRLLLKVSLMHAMELGAEMRATRSIDCKFDEEIAALLDTLKSDFDKGLLTSQDALLVIAIANRAKWLADRKNVARIKTQRKPIARDIEIIAFMRKTCPEIQRLSVGGDMFSCEYLDAPFLEMLSLDQSNQITMDARAYLMLLATQKAKANFETVLRFHKQSFYQSSQLRDAAFLWAETSFRLHKYKVFAGGIDLNSVYKEIREQVKERLDTETAGLDQGTVGEDQVVMLRLVLTVVEGWEAVY